MIASYNKNVYTMVILETIPLLYKVEAKMTTYFSKRFC